MGNAQGMRRIWRNQQQHHDNHHHHHHHHHHQDQSLETRPGQASPTAEYLSSQYYASPQTYPDGYIRNNGGQFIVNIQPSALTYVMNTAPPVSIPVLENLKANTIKNDVNLRKSTLRLEKDEENPGFYLVAFSFDAIAAGWICIFFLAREGDRCSLDATKPELYAPIRIPFEKGLGQKFRQEPGTGVNLSLFDEFELSEEGCRDIFPLVVRTETVPKLTELQNSCALTDEMPLNAPLPEWVHAQTTHATLEKKEDEFVVKVVKQIIYVDGVRYELQEIYGIGNADWCSDGAHGNDSGKECVVCLSEPRDTTVLPCRHMCMCSGCAKVLRFQSSRCPICRTPVERLLEIKVSNRKQADEAKVKSTTSD